jgi:hypothetical protein
MLMRYRMHGQPLTGILGMLYRCVNGVVGSINSNNDNQGLS